MQDIVGKRASNEHSLPGPRLRGELRGVLLPRRDVRGPGAQERALLMERFISRERNEPPDIDIDFEHERREEVIQYVYASTGASARRSPPR